MGGKDSAAAVVTTKVAKTPPHLVGPRTKASITRRPQNSEATATLNQQLSDVPTPARDVRPLRPSEKEFLKCCKRVREILKLEALQSKQGLDKAQVQKFATRAEAVQELVASAKYFPD